MLGSDKEWLFVATDTTSPDSDMSAMIKMGQDGCNMAFIINNTEDQDEAQCTQGVKCLVKEMVSLFSSSFENILLEELEKFSTVNIC